jgi:hypothetical protein
MLHVTYNHPVCNTWINKNFEDICKELWQCHDCASLDSLEYQPLKTSWIWCWHIEIPSNWVFGNWEQVRLYPVKIPIPTLRCNMCHRLIKILPSFIVRETSLTLPALIFISFIYEYSKLTWREIPQKLCSQNDQIAHSTLYKAVHRLGQLCAINRTVEKLRRQYLVVFEDEKKDTPWPLAKSLFDHTLCREKGLRDILAGLLVEHAQSLDFGKVFYSFINALNRLATRLKLILPGIYGKNPARCRGS